MKSSDGVKYKTSNERINWSFKQYLEVIEFDANYAKIPVIAGHLRRT